MQPHTASAVRSATRTLLLTVLFLFLLLILLLLLLMRFVAVDVQVGEQPWFALSEEPAQWLHYLVSQP